MNTDETSDAPELDWRLRCCNICDKDRVGDEPGAVLSDEWICQACLDTAPCDRCDGEHSPLRTCRSDEA